jgi:hypothetical protein
MKKDIGKKTWTFSILDPVSNCCSIHSAESAAVTELELSDFMMPYRCRLFFLLFEYENVDRNDLKFALVGVQTYVRSIKQYSTMPGFLSWDYPFKSSANDIIMISIGEEGMSKSPLCEPPGVPDTEVKVPSSHMGVTERE